MATKYYCLKPWSEMFLGCTGFITPCCEFSKPAYSWEGGELDINAVWNGEFYQSIRKGFAEGRLLEIGCEGCHRLRTAPPDVNDIPDDIEPRRRENLIKAYEACANQSLECDHAPATIQATFSAACNLDCIMCGQERTQDKGHDEILKGYHLLDADGLLESASALFIGGGEPLLPKETRRVLKQLAADSRYAGLEVGLTTNGQLLHTVMDELASFPRLSVRISIEGTGKTYEAIRRKGSWKRLDDNITQLLELGKRLGYDWNVHTATILMKSTVASLSEYVEWGLSHGLPMFFARLIPTRYSHDEDLLGNPGLLESIPGWRDEVDKAVVMLKEAGQTDSAAFIMDFVSDLESGRAQDVTYGMDNYEEYLESDDIRGKKIAIWGTSGNYRDNFAKWLERRKADFQFLGFFDNNEATWGTEVDGHPVWSPDHLGTSVAPDIIIIATALAFRRTIISQIRNQLDQPVTLI